MEIFRRTKTSLNSAINLANFVVINRGRIFNILNIAMVDPENGTLCVFKYYSYLLTNKKMRTDF